MQTHTPRKLFGERVRYYRRLQGWVLDDLAMKTGLTRASMSRIESGLQNPSLDSILRLADILQVPVSSLFEGLDVVSDSYLALAHTSSEHCAKKAQKATLLLTEILHDLKLLSTH